MKEIYVNWSDIKDFVDSRKLSLQWLDIAGIYHLRAFDVNFILACELKQTSSTELTDFENNYKALGNQKLSDSDINYRKVTRVAASNKGTSYRAHFFDFTTCSIDSLVCKSWDGVADMGFVTKYYKADDTEVTTQADIDLYAVKTVVNFSPMYDYELISGTVNLQTSPTENLRLWVTGGVSELGGVYVKEFIRNLNLKFISPSETLQTDGRASKFMKQTTMGVPYQTNQLQIVILCDSPGIKHDIMMNFEYFKL